MDYLLVPAAYLATQIGPWTLVAVPVLMIVVGWKLAFSIGRKFPKFMLAAGLTLVSAAFSLWHHFESAPLNSDGSNGVLGLWLLILSTVVALGMPGLLFVIRGAIELLDRRKTPHAQ